MVRKRQSTIAIENRMEEFTILIIYIRMDIVIKIQYGLIDPNGKQVDVTITDKVVGHADIRLIVPKSIKNAP